MEGKQKGCTFGKRGEYTFHQYETHKPSSNLEAEGIIWAFGSSLLQRLGDWQAHCSCIPLVHKVPFNVGATLRLAHKKCFCSSGYSNCPPTSLRPIRRPQNWKDIGHQWLSPQMSTPKSHFGRPTCLRLNKQTKSSFPSLDTWESCMVRFGGSQEYLKSIFVFLIL